MNFSELGYRGQFVQMAPSHRIIPESNFFMLATSFGNPSLVDVLFDECQREYLAANQDLDITSPFPKLTCLDGVSNRIYTTILFLNDFIYSNYNKSNFAEGFEFVMIQKVNHKIYWAQIGWPHIFLATSNKLIGLDHSPGHRPFNSEAPNLPHSLLGIDNSLNFRIESSNLKENENILFIKSQDLPHGFYDDQMGNNEMLMRSLFKTNPKAGAWLGRLNFSQR